MIAYDPVKAKTMATLLQHGFVQVHQPEQLIAELERACPVDTTVGDFKILYTPLGGDGLKHFEAVNRIVRKMTQLVYAVDEVDKHQQPGWAPPELYELVNYGRHCEVAMIGTARQPAQVSKEYTFGLTEICAFNITEPTQLKYFEAKCGEAAVVELPNLPQYGYLRWIQDGRIFTGKGWK